MASEGLAPLIQLLAKLPGLGPRSGQRAALHLVKHKEKLLRPLTDALNHALNHIETCTQCGNLDLERLCSICRDSRRNTNQMCVIETVADLWALERSGSFRGFYHVLGGTLSALDGVGPDALRIGTLLERIQKQGVQEVILALNMTVEGQTTTHYLAEKLTDLGVHVSTLAHGIPLGGELDYLDEGTLTVALSARRRL